MAPSPEKTIEPKAPDKRDSVLNSDSVCEPITKTSVEPKDNAGHIARQESQDNPPALSGLDEGQLKALLEEAITYKCPKDRELKSTLFKELLQEAESVEAPPPLTRTRFQSERNENRSSIHHLNKHSQRQLSHGGSLQDLAESKFFENSNTKLDNYSSRKNTGAKRKTVSVSARQSEGGSLPSNVNNSSSLTYDRVFFCDDKYKYKKSGFVNPNTLLDRLDVHKNFESDYKEFKDSSRKDYSDTYTTSCEINLIETASSSNSSLLRFSPVPNSLIDPELIEGCQAVLLETATSDDEHKQLTICDVISAEQEKSPNDERSDPRVARSTRLNYTSHAELNVNMENNNQNTLSGRSRTGNDLGSTIPFSQLDSKPFLLTSSYPQMPCVLAGKPSNGMTRSSVGWLATSAGGLLHEEPKKSLDENGNSLQAFNSTMASSQQQNALKMKREKPKQKKADRNVKVIRSEEVVGHRNETNIDLLVKFIENDVNPKKMNGISKMGKGSYKSDNVNNKQRYLEDKSKKKDGNRKNNKDLQRNLFKSNSLEEVSCSMLEDLTNHNSNITMRSKSKKETNSSPNDRRSWGEVCYMDDNKYETNCKNEEKPFEKQILDSSVNLINEIASNNCAELSEFHVVTKKKKTKKYHNHNIFSDEAKLNLQRNDYYNNHVSKYQENDFTNNHELYMNHCKIPEQRRKSTSSMPPSDKSDSSDLDSVHSLPVESTSKKLSVRQVSTSSGGTPQASYADIAKMANVMPNDHCNEVCFSTDVQDKWSSPQSKSMFPSLIESTTINEKGNHPKTMSLNNYNFPDLIESCHYYSEVQKKKENEDYKEKHEVAKQDKCRMKLKLTQSKSVDIDDMYVQNKNLRNDGTCKSAPCNNKSLKENQKGLKLKSEAEQNVDTKAIRLSSPKESRKPIANNSSDLVEIANKLDIDKYAINSNNTPSDLVSDCIHHDKLNAEANASSINTIEVVQCLPPVIILDEDFNQDESSSNDITFGFELNEKLLSGDLSDTDSSNTIVYQETEISDASSIPEDANAGIKETDAFASDDIIKNETTSNLPKKSSESEEQNDALKSTDNDNKIKCDNQDLKAEIRINDSKCLNNIQFIPPTNVSGFENHDKIVSFIGIAWDEILKGGTAQYYTG